MIIFLVLLIGSPQKGIDAQPIILDAQGDIYASEFIFMGTEYGIYTFDRNSEKWGRITEATGFPGNRAKLIGIDEGILWGVAERGLASADVRINDWQTYELPAEVEGIAFDDAYVWVAGEFGTRRLDRYVETWEDIDSFAVHDLFLDEKHIWFASDSGLFRFNRDFERIDQVPGTPKYCFERIIGTRGFLWFISRDHFISYNRTTEAWSAHPSVPFCDYAILHDSLFMVSKGTIVFYEPTSGKWMRFRDIEGLSGVNGIHVTGEHLLCATDDGLLVHNWAERSREIYSRKNGLVIDSLVDVYEEAKYLFVVSKEDIEFLDKQTGIWNVERFTPAAGRKKTIFFVDEAGAHAGVVKDTDLRLQGRLYYSETRSSSSGFGGFDEKQSDYENINVKLITQHKSNRLLSVYYDDTDKEQELYGFGYRGLEHDLLYRSNGGYLTSEHYEFDLIPEFSTLGGSAKLRHGNHSLDLQGGRLQSHLRSDFFTGKTMEKEHWFSDIQYLKNSFYRIYGSVQAVTGSADTIFVDDRNEATNSIGTKQQFTIGGITGDFDMLVNSIDYFIDYRRGIIHFLTPRSSTDVIVLQLGEDEIIIQSETVRDHLLENTYFVGPDIIPVTFEMVITDTLGQAHSLSEFGLDENGDGRVDPEFIDYDLGYLTFADDRPFPNVVYDSLRSIYTMRCDFRSPSVFYFLSSTPVLIGSEMVIVDGELLNRGTHYIVDYTSGILLFLQDDLVSDHSEIEVQYATVDRKRDEVFFSVQPVIEPVDGVSLAPGFSLVDSQQIGHFSGRIEFGAEGERVIKVVPQVAVTPERAWAQKHSLLAKYGMLSLHSSYLRMSEDFESFGAYQKRHGRLRQEMTTLAAVEPGSYIRIEGKYAKEEQIDSSGREANAVHAYGKVHYLNPRLPNGYVLLGTDYLPDFDKRRVQLNANYDMRLLNSVIKLHSVVRNDDVELSEEDSRRTWEYIVNTNVAFPFPISTDVYYRRNSMSAERLERLEDELRTMVNVDAVPGLFYTANYDLRTTSFFLASEQDLKLNNYFYNNLNIAPGRWYSRLSIVNFSVGAGINFEEYIGDLPRHYRKPVILLRPLDRGDPSSVSNSNNYFAAAQFTPTAQVVIWGKRTLTKGGNSYYSIPHLIPITRDELKVEYERVPLGYFVARYERKRIQSYPVQTDQQFYLEWNKPWAAFLRTKVTTNYRVDEDDYAVGALSSEELRGNLETLLRFGTKSYIRFYLGGTKWTDQRNVTDYAIVPGGGVNVNLFTFLYLQCDYETTHIIDGITTHTLTSRITGQF